LSGLNFGEQVSKVDATTLYPAYRKPFDLIFEQGKKEGWRAQGDFRTFLSEFAG
jgi:hypothetical protein